MLVKADNPNGGFGEAPVGKIGGVISTEATDFDGERLRQKGVDWSYFREHGFLNYNHTPLILGEPTGLVRKGDQTLVEGVLYLHQPKAREVYETAQAMRKSGASRSYGFSVEGKVLERDPKDAKTITKARVMNVSICEHPVNPEARMELRKALSVGYQTAAGMDGGFSPLVPQSLEGRVSSATFRKEIKRQFPRLTEEECDSVMRRVFKGLPT
tara:strand:+ start:2249 stop:2887 length:639 start_codon:yes stop_codon:yes gene_type:complete